MKNKIWMKSRRSWMRRWKSGGVEFRSGKNFVVGRRKRNGKSEERWRMLWNLRLV